KASTQHSIFFKVKGKVGYMAPEQARGQPVDARCDLFSLAVVLYEMLVGERLFVGDLMSTAAMIFAQPVAPPSSKRGELPAELDAVMARALSLDPSGRYQTAEEMSEALAQMARRQGLMCTSTELGSHMRAACGDDPDMWLKVDAVSVEH